MRKATIGRVLLAVAMAAVLAGLLAAGPAGAAGTAARPAQAREAGRPGGTAAPGVPGHVSVRHRQLITVTAASRGTSYATFRAYRVTGTKRVLVFGPWTARVGYHGIAPPGRKREGDGRTPSGRYGFSFFFGVDRSPGVAFPYRRVSPYDYWDDDPRSPRYNEWVDARKACPGRYPEPLHNLRAYDYAAVITYNGARTPGLGSAIFLHAGTAGPTAGCVSLPVSQLLRVLRWLRPGDRPLIVITAH